MTAPLTSFVSPRPFRFTEEDVGVRDRHGGDLREGPAQARRPERPEDGHDGPRDGVRDGRDEQHGHAGVLRASRAGQAGVPPRVHQERRQRAAMRGFLLVQADDRQGARRAETRVGRSLPAAQRVSDWFP